MEGLSKNRLCQIGGLFEQYVNIINLKIYTKLIGFLQLPHLESCSQKPSRQFQSDLICLKMRKLDEST